MSKAETSERNREKIRRWTEEGLTPWQQRRIIMQPLISLVQWGGVAVFVLLVLGFLMGTY